MKRTMSFDAFHTLNRARCEHAFVIPETWSLGDWCVAIAGEVGELYNLVTKARRGEHVDKEKIIKELADVVTYADLIASHLGIELEDVLVDKFNEVSERVGSELFLERRERGDPRQALTLKQAESAECEMRRIEENPTATKRELRLFMQSLMPCGHVYANLLTCADPPYGCAACRAFYNEDGSTWRST